MYTSINPVGGFSIVIHLIILLMAKVIKTILNIKEVVKSKFSPAIVMVPAEVGNEQ